MGLSDLYYKLEEKYYASLDWFDSKGVHFLYKIDEWLQSKNIPSFPIMALIFLVILAVIVLLILYFCGVLVPPNLSVNMKFVDVTNNAIVPNLVVSLSYADEVLTETTNSDGEILVSLPKDAQVNLIISSDKYILEQSSFVITSEDPITVNLKDKTNLLGSKTLHLYTDADSKALFSDIIELDLSCDKTNYVKKVTVTSGFVDLTDLPNDCGNLSIVSYDPEISKSISVGVDSLDLIVSEAKKTGKLRVIVQDETGLFLSNITVNAYDQEDVSQGSSITPDTGLAELALPIGSYYITAYDSGIGDFSFLSTKDDLTSECNKLLTENTPTDCILTLKKANIGKINLLILDFAGKPVKEAQVSVYKGDLQYFNETLKEDANGIFIRGVPEVGPYRVVIDSLQYMIYDNPNVGISETPLEVHLEAVKSAPILKVYVTANNEPIAQATVQLFKEGNLLTQKLTGSDGIAFFDRLESGKSYNAKVVKGEYSQTSKPIILDPRYENKLEVQMVVGKGNVDVIVLDKSGSALKEINVELYNAFTEKSIGVPSQTDDSGIAHFYGVSADKTVYAKASNDKGTSYSLALNIISNQTPVLTTYFVNDPSTLSVDFIGVYNSDGSEINTLPYNVVPNGEYYGLFLLGVPIGKPFSLGQVFFVGDGKTVQENNISIKKAEVLNGLETKGITYTAPLGFADDMLSKTTDNALWSSLQISKVNSGSSLVKVLFNVASEPKSKLFKLGYRASLKSGTSILRAPQDDLLGQNENVSEKLGFYADTSYLSFKSGNLICVNVACIDMSASDNLGNVTQVFDDMYPLYNAPTIFSFKIVSATKTIYKNVTVEISTKNGIDLSNASISVNAKPQIVEKKSGKFILLIPNFTPATEILGTVGFSATKPGDSLLVFDLISDSKEKLFTKEIKMTVDAPKSLIAEYVPGIIVPYVLNLGAVVVTDVEDRTPISDALVNVYLNDVLLKSGKTDGEGKLPLEIEKPNSGDVLKIKVNASGYNEVTTTVKITENVLVPEKAEVSIILDKAEKENTTQSLLLKTPMPYKLKVTKIGFSSGAFLDFVDIKFPNISVNTEFDTNLDLNIFSQLTPLGLALLEPKTFKTNIDIVVSAEEIDKSWNVQIPLTVYVKMFDSLDAPNCLALTFSNELSLKGESLKLNNTCMYKGKQVQLYNASIFVEWDGLKLGVYNFNKQTIDENGVLVLKEVKPKQNTINLSFVETPTVISGQAKAIFTLRAYFPTNNGLQEISASNEQVITVSDLKKCLQIISPQGQILDATTALMNPIILGVTPYNMGMSMLGGMYNPMLGANSGVNGYPLGFNNNMFGTNTFNAQNPFTYDAYSNLLNTTGGSNLASSFFPTSNLGTGTSYGTNPFYQTQPINNRIGVGNRYMDQLNYSAPIIEDKKDNILFDYYPSTPMMNPMMNSMMNPMMMQAMGQYGGGSPFAMGQYGAMMPGSFLPPYTQLQFRNNCNDIINIDVRAMPQIYVSPNTETIPQKQTKQITVMSGNLPGTYTMNVLAGTSQDNLMPLMTIPVNVIDYPAQTATPECFKLSDEPVINMSDVWKRNKLIKVYNYCYSKGVVFDETKPVEQHNLFSRKEVNAQNKNKQACMDDKTITDKTKCTSDLRLDEGIPYVIATPIGVPNIETSSTYGQIQVLDVMLEKDPSVQRLVTENLTKGSSYGDKVSLISGLRSGLADIYNNVDFPALFVINARIGYGPQSTPRTIKKLITVRDYWNILGSVDLMEGVIGGEKDCTPSGKEGKSWTNNINNEDSYTLKSSHFKAGKARIPFEALFELLKKPCFGTGDGVKFDSDKKIVSFKNGGDTIELEFVPVYKKGEGLYFDVIVKSGKLKGSVNNTPISFDYTIKSYYFSDASYGATHKTFTLNLSLDFSDELGTETIGTKETPKEVTTTKEDSWCVTNFGKEWKSLASYGFGSYPDLKIGNMLSFVYPTTNEAPADCTKTFCDAEQLKIFLKDKGSDYNVDDLILKLDGNWFVPIALKDVLDPLTKYFLERDLKKVIENGKYETYKSLVQNMPNLFLVKTTDDCDKEVGKLDDAFYTGTENKKCYYYAKGLSERNIKDYFAGKEFSLIIKANDNYSVYTLLSDKIKSEVFTNPSSAEKKSGDSQKSIVGAHPKKALSYLVYLKPDFYNAVFKNNSMFDYNAVTNTQTTVLGVYVVYYDTNQKKVYIVPADYYFPKEADDMLKNQFFYNLPIDPTKSNEYKGEYGLCISERIFKFKDGLSISTNECNASTVFAKAKVSETHNVSLVFKDIKDIANEFTLEVPACNTSSCPIEKIDKTKISTTKGVYYLTNIFNAPEKYCYSESSNNIEIKYFGGQ